MFLTHALSTFYIDNCEYASNIFTVHVINNKKHIEIPEMRPRRAVYKATRRKEKKNNILDTLE
jgi:hypothetical protein